MANIITAGNSTNGGTSVTTDTSGTLNIVTGSGSGATAVTVDGSQNLSFNSGYGSAAVAYGCRAWVNFNGTSTVAIRASGNVTSITDNGTGDYTVNFTTALVDANYSVLAMPGGFNSNNIAIGFYESVSTARTASLVRIFSTQGASAIDGSFESVAVFR